MQDHLQFISGPVRVGLLNAAAFPINVFTVVLVTAGQAVPHIRLQTVLIPMRHKTSITRSFRVQLSHDVVAKLDGLYSGQLPLLIDQSEHVLSASSNSPVGRQRRRVSMVRRLRLRGGRRPHPSRCGRCRRLTTLQMIFANQTAAADNKDSD